MSEYTRWCQGIFNCLVEGGVWAVPRSGLVFRKEEGSFVLCAAYPSVHLDPEPDQDDLLSEYNEIRLHFEEAGIPVRSEIKL